MLPGGVVIEGIAGPVEGHVFGQHHRQILLGHGNGAADLAVDDRDRATPIALAGNAPVAQAVVDLHLALGAPVDGAIREVSGDHFLGLVDGEPVEEAGIEDVAAVHIGFGADFEAGRISAGGQNYRRDREAVLAGQIQVALVMGRAAEDGAGAIVHENEVGDVDGERCPLDHRMFDAQTRVEALLFGLFERLGGGAVAMALGHELGSAGLAAASSVVSG